MLVFYRRNQKAIAQEIARYKDGKWEGLEADFIKNLLVQYSLNPENEKDVKRKISYSHLFCTN